METGKEGTPSDGLDDPSQAGMGFIRHQDSEFGDPTNHFCDHIESMGDQSEAVWAAFL